MQCEVNQWKVKEPSHLSDFSLLDIYTCINQKQGHVYLKKSSNRQFDWRHYLTQIILSYRKLVPYNDDLIPVAYKL